MDEKLRQITDTDRSPLVEARMMLMGLTGLLPTIEHLRALEESYEVRLIQIANDIEMLKKKVLNGK